MSADPTSAPPLLAIGGYVNQGHKPHWLAMRDAHLMARMIVDEFGGRSFIPAQYVMAALPCHDDNPAFYRRAKQEKSTLV